MKKLISIFAAASMFAACNSNPDLDAKKDVVLTDTAGMYKSNYSTDVPAPTEKLQAPVAQTRVIRETHVVYVDRAPKITKPVVREAEPASTPVVTPQPQQQPQAQPTNTASTGNGTSASQGPGNSNDGTASVPSQKEEKKGWSNAAKDAVIGGVVGGVGGAIISKKKGTGAVIGGILGAAGGYILGKKKDKKLENDIADGTN